MKNFILVLFIIFLVLTFNQTLKANIICPLVFSGSSLEDYDPTSSFLTYLGGLVESNTLTIEDLRRLQISLRNHTIENPIEYSAAATNPTLQISWEFFEDLVREKTLNSERILLWVSKKLEEFTTMGLDREREINLTKERISIPITFVPFIKTEDSFIEVSPYLVTQKQWVDVMHQNPSFNVEGAGSIHLHINGKIVQLKPNHPVEFITWWSALEFANRLSQLHGYKPHYNLKEIPWAKNSRAEYGHLIPNTRDDQTLRDMVFQVLKSPKSNGYRLLNEGYKLKLMNTGFSWNNDKNTPISKEMLTEYAWLQRNSQDTTQEVALLKANQINGNNFYDVFGNVYEWMEFEFTDSGNYSGQDFFEGSFLTNTASSRALLKSKKDKAVSFSTLLRRDKGTGFRLMRDRSSELSRSSK